jgi:hypothetical protein
MHVIPMRPELESTTRHRHSAASLSLPPRQLHACPLPVASFMGSINVPEDVLRVIFAYHCSDALENCKTRDAMELGRVCRAWLVRLHRGVRRTFLV